MKIKNNKVKLRYGENPNQKAWIEINSNMQGEISNDSYLVQGTINRNGLGGGNYNSNLIVSYGQNVVPIELQMYVPFPPILNLYIRLLYLSHYFSYFMIFLCFSISSSTCGKLYNPIVALISFI